MAAAVNLFGDRGIWYGASRAASRSSRPLAIGLGVDDPPAAARSRSMPTVAVAHQGVGDDRVDPGGFGGSQILRDCRRGDEKQGKRQKAHRRVAERMARLVIGPPRAISLAVLPALGSRRLAAPVVAGWERQASIGASAHITVPIIASNRPRVGGACRVNATVLCEVHIRKAAEQRVIGQRSVAGHDMFEHDVMSASDSGRAQNPLAGLRSPRYETIATLSVSSNGQAARTMDVGE